MSDSALEEKINYHPNLKYPPQAQFQIGKKIRIADVVVVWMQLCPLRFDVGLRVLTTKVTPAKLTQKSNRIRHSIIHTGFFRITQGYQFLSTVAWLRFPLYKTFLLL